MLVRSRCETRGERGPSAAQIWSLVYSRGVRWRRVCTGHMRRRWCEGLPGLIKPGSKYAPRVRLSVEIRSFWVTLATGSHCGASRRSFLVPSFGKHHAADAPPKPPGWSPLHLFWLVGEQPVLS